jgi:hypothetical protein
MVDWCWLGMAYGYMNTFAIKLESRAHLVHMSSCDVLVGLRLCSLQVYHVVLAYLTSYA